MLNTEYINRRYLYHRRQHFIQKRHAFQLERHLAAFVPEFVMCYPPGIPILAPGELITDEIIEYVLYAKEKGCSMQGTEDPAVEYLNVL